MIARNPLIAPVRRTAWFFSAMLLVLASALAAALIPSGPPASRLTGSAFDPSTSAVALRVRAHKSGAETAVAQRRTNDDAPVTAGSGPAVALLPTAFFLPAISAVRIRAIPRRHFALLTTRFFSKKNARAPPTGLA